MMLRRHGLPPAVHVGVGGAAVACAAGPHKSGLPDAARYAPVFQEQSAWQLYWGVRGTATSEITPNVWQRLRIVVAGRRAAVFLGDTTKPFMVVPHLARDPQAGYIAFISLVPQGTPGVRRA